MVSSQVLQKTIDELRAITRIDLCVLSVEGQMLVTTRGDEGLNADHVREFVQSPADSQVMQGYHFFKVYDDQTVEYVLVARGNSEDTYMIGKIAVCQIQNLIIAYKERLDKNNFIQNLLLDNLLLVDVYNRAKKLRIETDVKRVVLYGGDQVREGQQCHGNHQEPVRFKNRKILSRQWMRRTLSLSRN